MENLVDPSAFWRDRRVFLTGHTGFKGGWMALCLSSLGATVRGYALDPPTTPNLFDAAGVGTLLDDIRGEDEIETPIVKWQSTDIAAANIS